MSEITLSIPDDALLALKVRPDQLGAELRLAAAVKLYELGRISSGAAAKLAGTTGVRHDNLDNLSWSILRSFFLGSDGVISRYWPAGYFVPKPVSILNHLQSFAWP